MKRRDKEMIKNRKMDHIGLAVKDAKVTADWYQEVMGFYLKGQFPDNDGKTVYFVANSDDSTIYEIYSDANLSDGAVGKIDHIAFPSDDIERDYQFCVEKGYTICTDGIEAIPSFWENGVRYFKILSPSHEEVEFIQQL